jgi:hypothetical protein
MDRPPPDAPVDMAPPQPDRPPPDLPDPRPPVAIRINVGGPAHMGTDFPGRWVADAGMGGACGPNLFRNDNPIHNTTDDPLFHVEMFGNPLVCRFGGGTLPRGVYQVTLLFAEIYWGPGCPAMTGGAGSRVFDLFLENEQVLTAFDIFREAGGCAASTAATTGRPIARRFMVNVIDGALDLRAPARADNAKLSAIEILSTW